MFSDFLIVFRESLEAALVIGIILAFLRKTNRTYLQKHVFLGVVAGIIASILAAFLFSTFAGGFEGTAEQLFEGITMLFASLMLTYMIFWMAKQEHVSRDLRRAVEKTIAEKNRLSLFFLSFISVFREGVETVLFLGAASFSSSSGVSFLDAFIGIIGAVVLGFVIFETSMKVNIRQFFAVTSFFLILFSAGLFAHSVSEFQEAGAIPGFSEKAWDTSSILGKQGAISEFASSFFGYAPVPSVLRVFAYLLYISGIFIAFKNISVLHKFI